MNKALCLMMVVLGVAGVSSAGQGADQHPAVPGQYIVVFKDTVANVPDHADEIARIHGGRPLFVYQHALKGFAVALPEQAVAALSRNPNVAYIEPDFVVSASDIQANPTWGLDRIDQRDLPLNRAYSYNYSGNGVTAYILDTGIRTTHAEFTGGRATHGWDFVDDDPDASDCNGHGTHVAGTVGGATYGVAKGVHLVALRVLDCAGSGTTSGVIAAVDWVTREAVGPSVANMSLSGGASASLDQAVRNSITAGIGYAVAAGNGNQAGFAQDACNYSPARVGEAMTVSATDSADRKASWANYGSCVDWFAPGVSITSSSYTGSTAIATMSGTSMATPHTTGVAALYLDQYPTATPQQVRDAIYAATTKGKVTSSNTATNHLLYSVFDTGAPVNPPVGEITLTVSGYKVKGVQKADLRWSGVTASSVDVYRNDSFVITTANDGAHTDSIRTKGGGSYIYKVCSAGTTTCSNPVSVVF